MKSKKNNFNKWKEYLLNIVKKSRVGYLLKFFLDTTSNIFNFRFLLMLNLFDFFIFLVLSANATEQKNNNNNLTKKREG